MELRGVCAACHKRYKVPHARKEWRCKVCEEPLEIVEVEEALACPACGASVGAEDKYCEACGEDLTRASGGETRPGERARRSSGERRSASAEMRAAEKRVRWIRWVLGFNIFTTGLLLLLLISAAGWSPILLLVGTVLALNFYGLVQLRRRPFPVCLTLALLSTVTTLLDLFFGAGTGGGVLGTVFYWVATYHAARWTALAREFPDLYGARKLRGEHLRTAKGGKSALAGRHRGRGRAPRDWTAIGISAGAVAVVLVVGFLMLKEPAPDDPGPTLERVRIAWNNGYEAELAGFWPAESQEKRERTFRSIRKRYEWSERFPQAEILRADEQQGEHLSATLVTEGGDVTMRFTWNGDRWEMTRLGLTQVSDWRP